MTAAAGALHPGGRLIFDGECWVVVQLMSSPAGITVEIAKQFDRDVARLVTLAALAADPGFDLIDVSQPARMQRPPVGMLPVKRRRELARLAGHLNEVRTGYQSGCPSLARPGEPRPGYEVDDRDLAIGISRRLTLKAEELKMGFSTLRRHLDNYTPNDITSLMTRTERRELVTCDAGVDPIVLLAVEQIASELDKQSRKNRTYFREMVARRATQLAAGSELSLPGRNRMNQLLAAAERRHLKHLSTKSSASMLAAPEPMSTRGFQVDRPGELVLIDATKTNVMLLSDVDGTPMRCEIVAALDVYSHVCAAIDVSPVATSMDMAILLFDALRPKVADLEWPTIALSQYSGAMETIAVGLHSAYGGDEADQLANMPPVHIDKIGTDNGMVMVSSTTLMAMDRLDISVAFARPGTGLDKADIERFFGDLDGGVLQWLSGYVGRNVSERERIVSLDVTVSQFRRELKRWVAGTYHNTPSEGLISAYATKHRLTPVEKMAEGIARTGMAVRVPDINTVIDLLPSTFAAVTHDGVRVKGIRYWSDQLKALKGRQSTHRGKNAGKWPVRFHPHARQVAFLWDAERERYIELDARNLDDTSAPFADVAEDWTRDLVAHQRGLRDDIAAGVQAERDRLADAAYERDHKLDSRGRPPKAPRQAVKSPTTPQRRNAVNAERSMRAVEHLGDLLPAVPPPADETPLVPGQERLPSRLTVHHQHQRTPEPRSTDG